MTLRSKRHPDFDEHLAAFADNHPTLVAAVDGLEWSLQRDPKLGIRVSDLDVWRARIRLVDSSQWLVYYAFDKKDVRLLTITSGS